ncbi:MAG TPA: response regulator transcription factor, partial [Longimicrobiaceae bacterium]|nr:response regulator transcription factor [Longimicrobiaceae bacterium]
MKPITILLVDDHAMFRSGLRALLEMEPDLCVVGEAATGEDAVQMTEGLRPRVVLMDLAMPGIGGLEATRQIAALGHGTRVLAVTSHGEGDQLLALLEAGGSGFVTKHSPEEELVAAIRTVARGDVFLYPAAARVLVQRFRGTAPPPADGADPLGALSGREREVLVLTAEGYTSSEIGERLHI